MKSDKELLDYVNMSLHNNMGKAIISLLLIILLTSFSVPVIMFTAIIFAGTVILPFAILLFFVTLIVMLILGYLTLLANLHRKKPAVLGHIFSAFYQFKKNIGLALIIATVLVMLSSIISIFGLLFIPLDLDFSDMNSLSLYLFNVAKLLPLLSGILVITFFVAFIIPNGFIWFVKQEYANLSLKETFIASWKLTKGKKLHLLKFLLKSGGWWLIVGVLAYMTSIIINWNLSPTINQSTDVTFAKFSAIMNIFNTVYSVCFYCSIIRIFTGLVVFYDVLTGFSQKENYKILDNPVPILQLTESSTESQNFDEKESGSSEQNNLD